MAMSRNFIERGLLLSGILEDSQTGVDFRAPSTEVPLTALGAMLASALKANSEPCYPFLATRTGRRLRRYFRTLSKNILNFGQFRFKGSVGYSLESYATNYALLLELLNRCAKVRLVLKQLSLIHQTQDLTHQDGQNPPHLNSMFAVLRRIYLLDSVQTKQNAIVPAPAT